MTENTFGTFPVRRVMKLTDGQDFGLTLRNKVAGVVTNYPSGAALSIVFSTGTVWAATISTAYATWAINKSVSDLIADGTTYVMTYTDASGADAVPYAGPVKRYVQAQQ